MTIELNKNTLILSSILSLFYNSIGAYEIVFNGNLTRSADKLLDGLDLYTIFPSHVFGSIFYVIFGHVIGAWMGQILGFIIWTFIIYTLNEFLLRLTLDKKKIKQ